MSVIRGTALQGFRELMAALGHEPDPVLLSVGFPVASVGDPDAFVSYRATVNAVESAAAVTGTADFGRRLAERQGIEILGPVGVAARTAPTVGAALEAVGLYLSVYSPSVTTTVAPIDDDRVRLQVALVVERLPEHRQTVELSLGVAIRVLRLLAGPTFTPLSAHLPHDPLVPRKEYERYFGTRCRFAEPFAGFVLRRGDLLRPVSADGELHDLVRRYLSSVAPSYGDEVVAPIRQMIRSLLPTGALALEVVAGQLAVHPRTLQRMLAREGLTFAGLIDEVREEMATHYLQQTPLPLGQVAAILGYSEQSALSRACQRWFGVSPSVYRKHA